MAPAVVRLRFPRGVLPVEGWRCAVCGEEVVGSQALAGAQRLAQELGLYDPAFPLLRKLTKSGGQLALYIPKQLEAELALKQGARVRVFARGREIVVQPVE